VYRYNGPGNYDDGAWSIVMAADGNVYLAGETSGIGTGKDFTVISLDTSGTERWVYRYNGPGNGEDVAYSIATGPDSNVYVAGWSLASGTSTDLAVISLTPAGAERWVYRYNGPGSGLDAARAVVVGADGNLYAAGSSLGSGTNWDLVVISLTRSGGQRWVYRYNGPEDHRDEAYAIVMGADTNLYVAGASVGSGTYYDFTVIGLTRDIGVEERREGRGPADAGLKARVELFVSPTPALRRVNICYSLPAPGEVVLSVYDACGTLVKTLVDSREEAGSRNITWNGRDEDGDEVAGGTYFCRLSMSKLSTTKKLLLLR